MALTFIQVLFMIISAITFLSLSFLVITLFRKYLEKKTIGTMLLLLAYFDSLMADVLIDISVWLQILMPNSKIIFATTILMFLSVIFLIHVIAFMYFFGNRVALLKDNDVVKAIYTTFFFGLWGAYAGLGLYEIIQLQSMPLFYTIFPVGEENIFFIFPSINNWLSIIPISFMLIGTLTYFRIFYRCFKLARKAHNKIEQRTNTYNWLSVFFYLFTGITLALYYLSTNIYIMAFVFGIRGISIILASVYGYLGWIQPEFIKKSFREKTHISLYFEGKVEKPITPETFISTPETREKEIQTSVEKIISSTDTPLSLNTDILEVTPSKPSLNDTYFEEKESDLDQ